MGMPKQFDTEIRVMFDSKILEALDAWAKDQDLTRSGAVRRLVRLGLKREKALSAKTS